jgi:hypothetical protein
VDTFWRAFRRIDDGLRGILRSRNWNVHTARFSDDDVDLLNLLDLLSGNGELYEEELEFTYKEIRKKWVSILRRNAIELTRSFDMVCWAMEPYLGHLLKDDSD